MYRGAPHSEAIGLLAALAPSRIKSRPVLLKATRGAVVATTDSLGRTEFGSVRPDPLGSLSSISQELSPESLWLVARACGLVRICALECPQMWCALYAFGSLAYDNPLLSVRQGCKHYCAICALTGATGLLRWPLSHSLGSIFPPLPLQLRL